MINLQSITLVINNNIQYIYIIPYTVKKYRLDQQVEKNSVGHKVAVSLSK